MESSEHVAEATDGVWFGAGPNAAAERPDADVWIHVEAVQAGRIEAFEHVYRTYAHAVLAYLCALTRDQILAQDLTSETFLRALKSIGSVQDQGKPLRAWLMTIARNLAMDHLKSWTSRKIVPVDREYFLANGALAPGADEVALRREAERRCLDSLLALPPLQRECLLWRYLVGLSVADTAQRMSRSGPAVRSIQHRAVRKLGVILAQEEAESCQAA